MEQNVSDIPSGNWVDRWAPAPLRPYLRLARADRPIGTWLLLFPCWWSVSLAASPFSLEGATFFVLFAIGALIMRGAGCTLNDIADRNFDAQVARTATRPIPSGAISVPKAFLFLGLQLLISLAVLVQFNLFAIQVGVASLGIVAIYPFMKRFTYWPQAILGLAFNWGALLGWAAVKGELAPPALLLYAAGVMWTLGYDTIYAHQDKEDDVLIGLKSTALKLGAKTKPWLAGFYTTTIVLMGAAAYQMELSWPFYAGFALAAGHLAWQVLDVDIDNPTDCLTKFKSNRDFAALVLISIIAGGFTF